VATSSFPSFALRTALPVSSGHGLFRSTKSSQANSVSARLGRRGRQVEAQRVGVVLAQKVGHVDGAAAALAELAAVEVKVFMVTRDKGRSP
jgi:hypothetical protein